MTQTTYIRWADEIVEAQIVGFDPDEQQMVYAFTSAVPDGEKIRLYLPGGSLDFVELAEQESVA